MQIPFYKLNIRHAIFFSGFIFSALALAQEPSDTEVWEPVPEFVESIPNFQSPPENAVVLFQSGWQLGNWQKAGDGSDAEWQVYQDFFEVLPGKGDIKTRQTFKDFHLHLEWRTPFDVQGEGQLRGNSGVYLAERYEVQILDCDKNPTYVNGQAASIYKQHIPLYNACKSNGEWQSYDIYFQAPTFDSSTNQLIESARVTVIHNGIVVQDNVEIKGSTVYIGQPKYEVHGEASILLQDHNDKHSPGVQFRNIWIKKLNEI